MILLNRKSLLDFAKALCLAVAVSVGGAVTKAHAAQELESYPLDSMSMVGTLQQAGKSHALLMVENRLHDVKVGDWIGQNYGQITGITDTQITLRETVQDATGEWIERASTLQIQEKAR